MHTYSLQFSNREGNFLVKYKKYYTSTLSNSRILSGMDKVHPVTWGIEFQLNINNFFVFLK